MPSCKNNDHPYTARQEPSRHFKDHIGAPDNQIRPELSASIKKLQDDNARLRGQRTGQRIELAAARAANQNLVERVTTLAEEVRQLRAEAETEAYDHSGFEVNGTDDDGEEAEEKKRTREAAPSPSPSYVHGEIERGKRVEGSARSLPLRSGEAEENLIQKRAGAPSPPEREVRAPEVKMPKRAGAPSPPDRVVDEKRRRREGAPSPG